MNIALQVDDVTGELPPVEYRWDPDTDILTAGVTRVRAGAGMSGSVEIEGSDGSWLIFDVHGGEIASVEVAVWPDVKITAGLMPPAEAAPAHVTIPSRRSQPGFAALEVDTRLTAEADAAEKTIHFRLGGARVASTLRVARDLLVEIDERSHLVGVWMLNVPPFPGTP